MAYTIEILGTNTSTARAYAGEQKFHAFPSRSTNSGPVRLGAAPNEFEPAPVAVFATQQQANEIGLACRWNNQTYRVKRSRQPVNVEAFSSVEGCQS